MRCWWLVMLSWTACIFRCWSLDPLLVYKVSSSKLVALLDTSFQLLRRCPDIGQCWARTHFLADHPGHDARPYLPY